VKTKYILVGVVLGAILLVSVLYWTFGPVSHRSQHTSAQPCSRPAAGVQTFTDDNFDREVVESDCPVLVFFTAAWAGPARAVRPVVNELANEYAGRLKVGALDVDRNPTMGKRYEVKGIPSVLFFRDGHVARKVVGVVPKETFERDVERTLSGDYD
jgi:thioredoxin 1